ncbi:hypothetical protein TI39_contig271g00003 [Zymoseptoria brevis]|uniref:Uncharacterized protein n=1 Tax=Zymoseptoria brevis TaxID=1047168 RepID=A0A0F4GWY7_9PEZI|nr:hypothetical protein TI39_contig271g00003 [Zymoseptoria brevis]
MPNSRKMLSKSQLPLVLPLLSTLSSTSADIIPAHSIGNATWPYQTYRTTNFTPPYLSISRSPEAPPVDECNESSEAYLFFAPLGTAFEKSPLIMSDRTGDLVWNGPNASTFGFGVQEYQGEKVLVGWTGTSFPEPIGRGNGAVAIWNKNYELIANVTLPGNFLELAENATYPSNIDLHEIFITEKGSMIVTANNVTAADLSEIGGSSAHWIVEAQVYEIDIATNDVLFEWKSLDHLEKLPFTASVYPLGSEGYDGSNQTLAWGYFHINAASPYLDGGYLLSSRYLASAIALDSEGQVLWRLSGINGSDFTLGEGADFRYQHDIRLVETSEDNSILTLRLFDNHNSPIENNTTPSSGKLLSVDLKSNHVTLLQRFLNESGPVYPTAQGAFNPVENGNYFKGNGFIPVLEEFSPTGEILSTIQFGVANTIPSGGYVSGARGTLSYRGFKQTWVGCPTTKPSIVAEKWDEGEGVRVWVSWNGATEVVGWRIWGGKDEGSVAVIEEVEKVGFETKVEVESVDVEIVRVEAVWREGAEESCTSGGNGVSDLVVVQEGS